MWLAETCSVALKQNGDFQIARHSSHMLLRERERERERERDVWRDETCDQSNGLHLSLPFCAEVCFFLFLFFLGGGGGGELLNFFFFLTCSKSPLQIYQHR